MPDPSLNAVEGKKRKELVVLAKQEEEYKNLDDYFKNERSLSPKNIDVYQIDEQKYVINFNYESDDGNTIASISLVSDGESIIDSFASIDYYLEDSLASVDVCEVENGDIHCTNTRA